MLIRCNALELTRARGILARINQAARVETQGDAPGAGDNPGRRHQWKAATSTLEPRFLGLTMG